MSGNLRIALAQLNLWVGDVEGNVDKILAAAERARDELGAELCVTSELALLGYPPDDLLLRSGLPELVEAGLARLRDSLQGIAIVVGFPQFTEQAIYNTAAVYQDREELARYYKQCLPNYGVFDERRHFSPGDQPCVFELAGHKIGLTICEDVWDPAPARQSVEAGAELLININASPFNIGKSQQRREILRRRVAEIDRPIIYVNCVGGQDELVFDGDSMAFAASGAMVFQAPPFAEDVYPIDLSADGQPEAQAPPVEQSEEALVYQALVQAVRDYAQRNRFSGVVLGVSGGIDSAVALAVAADAVGAEQVHAVYMPSRFSAQISGEDAQAQAQALGVHYDVLDIEPAVIAFNESLAPLFKDREPDVTEENIQARCRGLLLMALSNKFNYLVLATGNKSEMAVGYATLYGDMVGGFAPLKDVYKGMVYRLAKYRNSVSPVIPERVIERPPSAELRADQTDQDSLPDYEELDAIIHAWVEQGLSIDAIIEAGHDADTVRRIARMIRRAEYKRRQAAPGPKITAKAFGRDRRYPITAVYGDL